MYAQKLQIVNRNSTSLLLFSNCEVLFYVANKPTSSLAFRNWSDNSVSGSYITGNRFRTRVSVAVCCNLPIKCTVYVCLNVHRPGMIPAGNVIDAHAQNFVVNDEKLLLVLKTFAECTRSLQAMEMLDVFIVCLAVEMSVASTNSSPVYSQQYAAPQQTRPSHAWIISWSVDCTCSSVGQHHKLILFNCLLVISFNKVSLPTDHHNLLTHWLGSHSEQYSMGVWRGLGALSCAAMVEHVWNVMAHAQKPDFVFRRNGRVHLNRRGNQFSRLLAVEECGLAGRLWMDHIPRHSARSSGYLLQSPISPSLPLPRVTVCHHVCNGLY